MSIVLAFDIGLVNLAFAQFDKSTNEIIAIKNCNILHTKNTNIDDISQSLKKSICTLCKIKPSYIYKQQYFCKRHINTLDIELLSKTSIIPNLSELKIIIKKKIDEINSMYKITNNAQLEVKAVKLSDFQTKDKILTFLENYYAIPIKKEKRRKVNTFTIEEIHDALKKFVGEHFNIFKSATDVLLENQPVFKNPHMKTVQILLFAILREAYLANHLRPNIMFVHAKKKVQSDKKGDAGYKDRKAKSEQRVHDEILRDNIKFIKIESDSCNYREIWETAKKKSDMADALCMCLDFGD
jgi:hypothetical protein